MTCLSCFLFHFGFSLIFQERCAVLSLCIVFWEGDEEINITLHNV
jgi:hypothetical protein